MLIKRSFVVIALAGVLGACANVTSGPYASAKSLVNASVQINSDFAIPDNRARVYFQNGEKFTRTPSDRWTTYCSVLVQDLQQPGAERQIVQPGEFGVTRVKQSNDYTLRSRTFVASREWTYDPPSNVTYKIEMRLASDEQPDVRSLICEKRVDAYGQYHPTLAEARTALGDWVEIRLAE
ncbi:MAG: hypothetical protein AAF434_05355 [Pseudomonadota bacterium]